MAEKSKKNMEYHSISGESSPKASSSLKNRDPFYEVKEKVKTLHLQISSDYNRWKDLLENSNTAGNEGFQELQTSLKVNLKAIEVDLNDLQKTVSIVDTNRSRFRHITDDELNSRRKFVNDKNAVIQSIKETVESERTKSKVKKDRTLMDSPGKRQDRMDLFSGGDSGRGGVSNDEYMGNMHQQQSMMIQQQDIVLDDMTSALSRLGDVAGTINTELKVHEEMINELDDDIDHAQSNMDVVMGKLEKLLGSSQKGKYCCLFWMIVIVFALAAMIIYL